MAIMTKKRLGDMLLEENKINISQLKTSLEKQKFSGKKLGELLIEEKLVTEEEILEVLEKQLGIERINLELIAISEKMIALIPEAICLKYELIPFDMVEGKIKIAIWDPLNIFAIDDVSIATGLQVETYITARSQIKRSIEKYYSSHQVLKAAEELSKEKHNLKIEMESLDSFSDIKNAPVVKMVDYLIKSAIEDKASDIHIEPYEDVIRIRYRIDGELKEMSKLSIDTLPSITTRIKVLANLNIAEKRVPQDGRIVTNIDGELVDLRISILPMITGEKIVIRVLDKASYELTKEYLGLNEEEIKSLNGLASRPNGIILVTGPTGSGKTTTLYSVLRDINTENRNIITIEDPVEYTMEGVNQVNVNTKVGLTFANGLRAILRQDPDVVMIGEIRDNETAEIAIRAAITGHLVLSTLHTNDAASSITRLLDMGLEPYLVATAITGVVAQRLVRKICPKCGYSYEADDYEKRLLNVNKNETLKLRRGAGCPYCNGTGYYGRVGVYEIMEVTSDHRKVIVKNNDIELFRELCMKNGMRTLKESCREKVIDGITTLDEMMKIAYLKE